MIDQKKVDNPSVVFVGAGNLATHLALALYHRGINIKQVYSRTMESAKILANRIKTKSTHRIEDICDSADLYITALTDRALLELAPKLTEGRKNALWVHTAGSMPLSLWETHCTHYGVFYPLQTFSKEKSVDFSQISLFIEASTAEDTQLLESVAHQLTDKVFRVNSEQRKSLHLAAVFACNFTNHMYVLAADLLKKQDLPFDVLLPLINETAEKVHVLDPQEAQTGPASRKDKDVMEEHLSILNSCPNLQHIYREISKSILKKKENN